MTEIPRILPHRARPASLPYGEWLALAGDGRAPLVEARRLLEGVGELEHAPLVLMTAHDLEPYRQAVVGTCERGIISKRWISMRR
jgi:hypothetical protein